MSKACWDCGSTIRHHHTQLCEMAENNAKRDLPAVVLNGKKTQWWVDSTVGCATREGAQLNFHGLTGVVVNGQTELPGAGAYQSALPEKEDPS